MTPSLILAIDTSTEQASVALADSAPRAEMSWGSRDHRRQRLIQVVQDTLRLGGAELGDLSLIACAVGPGSFNGLRVGVATAKGLAMSLGVPLVGINSLDAAGFGAAHPTDRIWAAIPAGKGEVFVGAYLGGPEDWRRVGEHRRLPLPDASELLDDGDVLVGPGAQVLAAAGTEAGRRVHLRDPAWNLTRASFLAELSKRYVEAGGTGGLDEIQPLYLRASAAEEKRAAAMQE